MEQDNDDPPSTASSYSYQNGNAENVPERKPAAKPARRAIPSRQGEKVYNGLKKSMIQKDLIIIRQLVKNCLKLEMEQVRFNDVV